MIGLTTVNPPSRNATTGASGRPELTALALASLQRALERWNASQGQDEELRDACIQRFEYSFELSWKMLKRRLEADLPDAYSVDAMGFRDLVRAGAERGLLAEADGWMVFRDKRSITSHTYNACGACSQLTTSHWRTCAQTLKTAHCLGAWTSATPGTCPTHCVTWFCAMASP